MYYLWEDKKKGIFFMTDYKEVREDGFVKIDGHGFLEVTLACTGKTKWDFMSYAEKQASGNE